MLNDTPYEMDNLPPLDDSLIFRTANDFSLYIEMTAAKEKLTCTEVIIEYCDMRDLDADDISKMVSTSLREKIKIEMQDLGLMRRSNQLEFV